MKIQLLTVATALGILLSPASNAQTTLYGITTANAIFTMSSLSSPSSISGPYSVSGVASGQVLAGIDVRPSNGRLYALGYDSVALIGELYTITGTGTTYTATAVSGTLASMNLGGTNNVALDFISTVDHQIRVVGRNGNNYVMNADAGTIISTGTSGISYAMGDLYSGASVLAATAFTNSFYGSDATTEVGYDAANNVLVALDAGNFSNGFDNTSNVAHSIGVTTGVIFTTGGSIGMDTWFDTLTHNNSIFLTGSTLLSGAHLYRYDMSGIGGLLVDMGAIGSGSLNVRDIALQTHRDTTSAVSGHLLTALSLNLRNLVYFDANNPNNIRRVVRLNGITTGQSMVAIDYSSTGSLYGLGYNSGTQTYQLYLVDSATGNVSAVNSTPFSLNLGSDDGSGNRINAGFRFIPTLANRIRIMGNNGSINAQIDAATGAIAATDTAVSFITGDVNFGASANISSIAFTGFNGDTATQMFGFDNNTGTMLMFNRNNSMAGFGNGSSGYVNTSASLSTVLSLLLFNSTYNNAHMNIAFDAAADANVGYMASNYEGDSSSQLNFSVLYDMTAMLTAYHKGTASTPTTVGRVGSGTPVKDVTLRRSNPSTTAVANVTNNFNDLLVYPNPVVANTHIVLNQISRSNVVVTIVNMNGMVERTYQYAPGTQNLDVDMSRLAAGMYSIRVSGADVPSHNLKVVKQ